MKKQVKIILIALCLLTILFVAVLAACVNNEKTITVTVNVNIDGVAEQTFTVDKDSEFLSQLDSYLPQSHDGLTFAGWYDSNGAQITAQTRWDKNGTVTAQWNTTYTTEYYLQTNDGFVKNDELTAVNTARVGTNVTADQITINGYNFDASNSLNVTSATLSVGTTLKLYYKCATFTVTFNKNNPNATGEMGVQSCLYNTPTKLMANGFTWRNSDHSDFAGWNTSPDGLGNGYTDECEVTLTGNITLYAQWKVSYTEQIYVERLVDGEYVYVPYFDEPKQFIGYLNNSVPFQTEFDEPHYVLNEAHPDALTGTTSLQENDQLSAYYAIERFTVFYNDDQTTITVRYGESYTIRTPQEDPDSAAVVITYSTSPTGDGREYPFGKVITIEKNYTLYPIYADVFTDAEGSGDRVVIRLEIQGRGAAKLVKNGVGYLGFVEINNDAVTFTVTVRENDQDEGVTYYGKLLSDGKFIYRNDDEYGTYLLGSALFPDEVYTDSMLALDGYGTGVLAEVADDGSNRTVNYYVNYWLTEDGDYCMRYFLPARPDTIYEYYFKLVHIQIPGTEEMERVVGYFVFCGAEYGLHTLVYNGAIVYERGLFLNGYDSGTYYYFVDNGTEFTASREISGKYYASQDYTDEAPEFVFVPDDTAYDSFIFIVFAEQNPNTGDYVYFFMQKHDEVGKYYQVEGSAYPELELDGYGVAVYVDSENANERWGSYTLYNNDGVYEVTIKFVDETGSTMRVSLDLTNNTYDSFGDFDIQNGVLVKYYGTDSVIVVPEGVTEIAGNAFIIDDETKDRLNIATLTLPATLTKIDDYAFQNSSNSGKSALKTVYLNATTPPELGADPFRWVTSEFKIIVPNGSEEAYRNAATWSTLNGSATYADYVTSLAEIADKPLYEIKNGVLLSYNNKDENPANVAITIPDEVTEIAAGVFEGRAYITSVNLNNVTVIGASAFDGCINLTSVTFNANTVSIGDYAFYNCLGLTEVELGNVQTIGNGAFVLCYNLVKVDVGNAITSIGQQAFALCAVEVDENETVTKQNELIVTISGTKAPTMSNNIFQGSMPRIYIDSYSVGVGFANSETWTLYARHLRVKADETQTLYSMSNMGAELVLADNAMFDESRSGLYKWEGNDLYIAWFDRDEFTNQLTVLIQVGEFNENTGLIRGFTDYDNNPLVFVVAGTEMQYSNDGELLTVTFGDSAATYNGHNITIDIINYRMWFNYNGYRYHLELAIDNTFTYTRSKIEHKVTYTAEDGAQITVSYGNIVTAIGTIKNVDGKGLSITAAYLPWSLNQIEGNTYTWTAQWREDKYKVTATFNDEDNTFTYFVGEESTNIVYSFDGEYDDYAVVKNYASGRVDIEISFETANGRLSCNCSDVKAVEDSANVYLVVIDVTINVLDAEGNVVGQMPSEFNGAYTINLNSEDNTYTLTAAE